MRDLLSGAGGRAQPQGASVRVPGLAPQGLPLIFIYGSFRVEK